MRSWIVLLFCLNFGTKQLRADKRYIVDPYLLVSRDQSLCLVMRPLAGYDVSGNRFATLPDGRRIDLNAQFPSNGVFRLPDLKPVYFLDWYDRSNTFVLSTNFMSLVHVQRSPGGYYTNAAGLQKQKVIQFYDTGREARFYGADDLVEDSEEGHGLNTVRGPEYSEDTQWLDEFRNIGRDAVEVLTVPRGALLE